MKNQKSVLALALFLALTAVAASAAPAPEVAAAETQPVAETQPTDVFGASVLSVGDCGASASATSAGFGDPSQLCGQCSLDPCKGAGVGSFCGFNQHGLVRYCQDWSGMFCEAGDGVYCRCHHVNP